MGKKRVEGGYRGVKYMVTEGDWTSCGGHTVQYEDMCYGIVHLKLILSLLGIQNLC